MGAKGSGRHLSAAALALTLVLGLTASAPGCSSSDDAIAGGSGGTSDAGSDATPPGDSSTCKPKTCFELGAECGSLDDGCGEQMICGSCILPDVCQSNKCSCPGVTCQSLGAECGIVEDGCNSTLDCGACANSEICGGGGPNKCGTSPCIAKTCAELGKNCGQVSDGCGKVLDCGSCSGTETCGGAGTPNVCGCKQTTCAAQGKNCGSISDGCGGTLSCGSCSAPQTCGGGGKPGVCGCTEDEVQVCRGTPCPSGFYQWQQTCVNGCGGCCCCESGVVCRRACKPSVTVCCVDGSCPCPKGYSQTGSGQGTCFCGTAPGPQVTCTKL